MLLVHQHRHEPAALHSRKVVSVATAGAAFPGPLLVQGCWAGWVWCCLLRSKPGVPRMPTEPVGEQVSQSGSAWYRLLTVWSITYLLITSPHHHLSLLCHPALCTLCMPLFTHHELLPAHTQQPQHGEQRKLTSSCAAAGRARHCGC